MTHHPDQKQIKAKSSETFTVKWFQSVAIKKNKKKGGLCLLLYKEM